MIWGGGVYCKSVQNKGCALVIFAWSKWLSRDYPSTSDQIRSVAQSCPTLCDPMNRSMPGLPVYHPTPRVYPNPCPLSQWCHPAISSCRPLLLLPPIRPSIRVFSNESTLCMRWPKYWSYSLSISPSNEHPGLISFRMDWLDLLAVQGTLKSLLQHHSSKACSKAFFKVQLSHPYMTTGKTIALTRWTRLVTSKISSRSFFLSLTFIGV